VIGPKGDNGGCRGGILRGPGVGAWFPDRNRTLSDRRWTLSDRRWTLSDRRWTLSDRRWTLSDRRWTLSDRWHAFPYAKD